MHYVLFYSYYRRSKIQIFKFLSFDGKMNLTAEEMAHYWVSDDVVCWDKCEIHWYFKSQLEEHYRPQHMWILEF